MSTRCFYSSGLLTLVFELAAGFYAPGHVRLLGSTENLLWERRRGKKKPWHAERLPIPGVALKDNVGFLLPWYHDWKEDAQICRGILSLPCDLVCANTPFPLCCKLKNNEKKHYAIVAISYTCCWFGYAGISLA